MALEERPTLSFVRPPNGSTNNTTSQHRTTGASPDFPSFGYAEIGWMPDDLLTSSTILNLKNTFPVVTQGFQLPSNYLPSLEDSRRGPILLGCGPPGSCQSLLHYPKVGLIVVKAFQHGHRRVFGCSTDRTPSTDLVHCSFILGGRESGWVSSAGSDSVPLYTYLSMARYAQGR